MDGVVTAEFSRCVCSNDQRKRRTKASEDGSLTEGIGSMWDEIAYEIALYDVHLGTVPEKPKANKMLLFRVPGSHAGQLCTYAFHSLTSLFEESGVWFLLCSQTEASARSTLCVRDDDMNDGATTRHSTARRSAAGVRPWNSIETGARMYLPNSLNMTSCN